MTQDRPGMYAEESIERDPIAIVRSPNHGNVRTKFDPVSKKVVIDRQGESDRLEGAIANAEEYIEHAGDTTPRIDADDDHPTDFAYRSDEETDDAFMSDEFDRAKAYEEGRVDPIEGLVALEESDDPLLQDHDAKKMRDDQEGRDSDEVRAVQEAWSANWNRRDEHLYPYGLSVPQASHLAGLAVDALRGQEQED